MIRIFIIILNWNGKDDSLECLNSLRKLKTANFKLEIVVVDNGSDDGSQHAIKQFIDKTENSRRGGIRLIENRENLGFAAGNNVGLRVAQENGADFILVLNNDTVVDKDLLVGLIDVARQYSDAGVLSPKIYFAPGFEFHKDRYRKQELGKVLWYAGGLLDRANVLGSNRGVDEVDAGQYDKVEDTDFATGACMLVRGKALQTVGLFNEDYFMYLEDLDFSWRARQAGWRVLYAPPACLWHKVARSSGIGSRLNDYYITRNRMLFGMRYASSRTKWALVRESLRFLSKNGVKRRAVIDYYLKRWGKGNLK